MSVYLDYNASAPIDDRVLERMTDVYENYVGNADSRTHNHGENARIQVELARNNVSSLLGVNKDEVIFTSGATESNNIAVLGLRQYGLNSGRKHIITTALEHKAIIEAVRHLETEGFDVDFVSADASGRVSFERVKGLIREDTLLVSVMHVNNETGIIQPVVEIGEYLSGRGVYFHVDATQSCGKLVPEIRKLKYDMMSVSAHKLHGPQGVGALIMRKRKYRFPPVKPIMFGGSQEQGLRPGTLPVALIAGFGKACSIAEGEFEENHRKCIEIKNQIISILEASGIRYVLNGDPKWCVSNTLNISFPEISSEAIMLSTRQYCSISNGSACTSAVYSPSHVLTAMNLPDERIESAVRISWGADSDIDEIKEDFSKMIDFILSFAS